MGERDVPAAPPASPECPLVLVARWSASSALSEKDSGNGDDGLAPTPVPPPVVVVSAADATDTAAISGGGCGCGGEAVAEWCCVGTKLPPPVVSQGGEDPGGGVPSTPGADGAAAALGTQQWARTSGSTSAVDMGLRSTSIAPYCLHAST